jgi:hypothetical protein
LLISSAWHMLTKRATFSSQLWVGCHVWDWISLSRCLQPVCIYITLFWNDSGRRSSSNEQGQWTVKDMESTKHNRQLVFPYCHSSKCSVGYNIAEPSMVWVTCHLKW